VARPAAADVGIVVSIGRVEAIKSSKPALKKFIACRDGHPAAAAPIVLGRKAA
jgi:hypothetical protein